MKESNTISLLKGQRAIFHEVYLYDIYFFFPFGVITSMHPWRGFSEAPSADYFWLCYSTSLLNPFACTVASRESRRALKRRLCLGWQEQGSKIFRLSSKIFSLPTIVRMFHCIVFEVDCYSCRRNYLLDSAKLVTILR